MFFKPKGVRNTVWVTIFSDRSQWACLDHTQRNTTMHLSSSILTKKSQATALQFLTFAKITWRSGAYFREMPLSRRLSSRWNTGQSFLHRSFLLYFEVFYFHFVCMYDREYYTSKIHPTTLSLHTSTLLPFPLYNMWVYLVLDPHVKWVMGISVLESAIMLATHPSFLVCFSIFYCLNVLNRMSNFWSVLVFEFIMTKYLKQDQTWTRSENSEVWIWNCNKC
jgi:hypothetical protein